MEVAGSTVYLISSAVKGDVPKDEGYKIFNIRFAQYLRSDFDFRTYKYLNDENILAFRTAIGYARPYGNSQYLPFEKSYFAGGSNGVRAWNIRSLGPGGFDDSNNPGIDKIGDIALETSVEYRFPVYKMLKSAIFVDAGNVWLEKENQGFPLGDFQLDRFYKEIALGAGFGLRLDFSFFVIRGDFAAPVRNPERAENDRWVIRKTQLKDLRFNLGIGYPF
jgi:outer membrane protein assembly factor BamA